MRQPPPEDPTTPYAYAPGRPAADEERLLAEALAGWAERYPQVPVEQRSVRAATRETLVAESGKAQLLVVGARGRGGFTGLLLGPVSQAVLHHAHFPVAVVGLMADVARCPPAVCEGAGDGGELGDDVLAVAAGYGRTVELDLPFGEAARRRGGEAVRRCGGCARRWQLRASELRPGADEAQARPGAALDCLD